MKPQCTTAAECLRELARVMEQFGIEDSEIATASQFVRYERAGFPRGSRPKFDDPTNWQFAIAEVEGKPVFLGDELYSVVNGNKYTATKEGWHFDSWTHGPCTDVAHMSWNPPKPKTVMVELLVEDAEFAAINWARHDHLRLQAVGSSCKKALEELK